QPITADSIRIARNNWTTHNKVVFYSNDSIRINDFIPSDAAVSPPEFSDAVLIRHIATPPADRDLLKSKLTGEWVVSGEKDSYVYAFADNDMVYTKTTKGQTIDLWPYQTITGDSIRIIRNWRTTHNKIAFYSNDSIRIEDFILSNVYLPLPEFSDAVLIRFIATSPPEEKPDDILPACTNRTGHVLYYLTDHKTTILKEIPPYQSLSSCIVIAKLFDDTEPTAWLVGKFGLMTYFRICNYPQYAKEWDILENGLPVLLSGKVYPASFNPGFHTTDMAFSDLELTMLKNELP
ncbi:MAG: hypothetical protein LBM08_15705, partial [Dysgonamonadaceae bacterium]|nr:hypothetical protein [Dysgonamonadaceae bacterium]